MPERTDQPPEQPTQSPGDILTAAREAHHLAHCARCRELRAASDAAVAENGESMARRDRLTLGFRTARTPAVTG